MIVIDGVWWFVGALVITGYHVVSTLRWRREVRRHHAWWLKYDAEARQCHETFMAAIRGENRATGVGETDREYCPSCGHELPADAELDEENRA